LLLPLGYLAVIFAVHECAHFYAAHFTGYYGIHFTYLGTRMGSRLRYLPRFRYAFIWLPYLMLRLVEAGLIFSVLKPIFLRRFLRTSALVVEPAHQPLFRAFIEGVAGLTGVRPPRIEVDCRLNASVDFERGAWGVFGSRFVITIGLPLIAALNCRELAGVVAHEFGHFTHGSGLRLSYVIRRMNRWLRAACERDAFDLWLERASQGRSSGLVLILISLTRGVVAFSRWWLEALMLSAQATSAFLLREMEYHADIYEIRVAGSATFEATTRHLAILNEALSRAHKEALAMWNLGRHLPDDFPVWVLQHETRLPIAVRDSIEAALRTGKSGWLATHPSNAERLRRARKVNDPGIFHLELPASMLFSQFGQLSRQASYFHYSQVFGLNLDSLNLRPTVEDR